ncbi:MAG: hypothetical protein LBI95_02565, partial [Holosporales bacterium]|nr:hypothetical protein [Holosporales bacterium]
MTLNCSERSGDRGAGLKSNFTLGTCILTEEDCLLLELIPILRLEAEDDLLPVATGSLPDLTTVGLPDLTTVGLSDLTTVGLPNLILELLLLKPIRGFLAGLGLLLTGENDLLPKPLEDLLIGLILGLLLLKPIEDCLLLGLISVLRLGAENDLLLIVNPGLKLVLLFLKLIRGFLAGIGLLLTGENDLLLGTRGGMLIGLILGLELLGIGLLLTGENDLLLIVNPGLKLVLFFLKA